MTVNTDVSSASYTGNGSTTSFTVPFYFLVDTDVVVTHKTAAGVVSTWVLNSDYTLAGAGVEAGGTLIPSVVLPTGDTVYIERNVDAVQQTAYPINSTFPAASHERALDRLTMLAQQILNKLTFGLFRDPLTSTYNAGGNTISNVADAVNPQDVPSLAQTQTLITGATSGIIPSLIVKFTDLAVSAGAALVGFIQLGTGAVLRTLQDKARERISVKDFGAVGDGTTDDTAAIQAAINAVQGSKFALYFPAPAAGLAYRTTAPLIVTGDIRLVGDGVQVNGYPGDLNMLITGTWIHADHTGKAIDIQGASAGSAYIAHLGVYRNQPDPTGLAAGAWTPTVNDADININGPDTTIEDMVLLNPTVGVALVTGGRLTVRGLRGQPIGRGIDIIQATDTCRIRDVHWWPFWSNSTAVRDYQLKNSTGFAFGRADNLEGMGLFTLGMYKGMELYQAAAGIVAKGRFVNCDFDSGQVAVLVSGNNVSAAFSNMSAQGNVSDTSLVYSNFQVSGLACDIQLDNVDLRFATAACIRNQGSGSIINIGNLNIAGWNYNNSGHTGIEAAVSDAEVYLAKRPNVLSAGIGSTAFIGGAGISRCPLTAGGGNITTDAGGFATITHGAGITPRRVFTQSATSNNTSIARVGLTATTFQVQVRTASTGSPLASTTVSLDWQCEY